MAWTETNRFTASLSGVHLTSAQAATVKLSILPENVHIFDRQTGRRIG